MKVYKGLNKLLLQNPSSLMKKTTLSLSTNEEFGDEHIGSDSPEKAPPVLDSAVPGDRLSVLGSAEWVDWELIYILLRKPGIQAEKMVYKLKGRKAKMVQAVTLL